MQKSRFLPHSKPRLAEIFKRAMRPAARSKDDNAVWLFHGTSEAHLKTILEDGFQPRYQGARDKVRSAISGMVTPQEVETKVAEMLDKGGMDWRIYEVGNILYTTADRNRATSYGIRESAGGGEIASRIHGSLFASSAMPSGEARPVMLELKTPNGNVLLADNGESYRRLDDGRMTVDSSYEVLLKTTGDVKVMGVAFARKENGSWTFEGQPMLSPKQALKQIQPQYAHVTAPPAADARQYSILKEINDFQTGSGVKITQSAYTQATYTAETRLDGVGIVRVPDIRFKPVMEEKFGRNFTGISSKYNLPHDLTPVEVNAYMTVLDVKEARGEMTADDKAAKMGSLYTEMERINPQLQSLDFDRQDPAKVSEAVRGVLNYIQPRDIQYHLRGGERTQEYKELSGITATTGLNWNFSPETLKNLNQQIEQSRPRPVDAEAPKSKNQKVTNPRHNGM